MFNIQKQGSSLLITSSDNTQFPWKDGKMSIPMNSITYVIDESDYIAFRSAANNDILFTANINEIQINGSLVSKDDFIMSFDRVANSTASGGGGGSEPEQYIKMLGEEYPNNLIWYMNQNDDYREIKFKTINGNAIMGEGDITVEGGGGGSATETDPVFTEWKDGSSISLGSGSVASNENDYYGGVAIGKDCETNYGIVLGNYCSSYNSIVIGKYSSDNDVENCVIIGNDLHASKDTYVTNINDVLRGDMGSYAYIKNEYGDYVRIPTEWIGTQSEYDALGEYYDNITYYIIEG